LYNTLKLTIVTDFNINEEGDILPPQKRNQNDNRRFRTEVRNDPSSFHSGVASPSSSFRLLRIGTSEYYTREIAQTCKGGVYNHRVRVSL